MKGKDGDMVLNQLPSMVKSSYLAEGGDYDMPRGDKSKYSDKQKRQAEHIEEGYKEQGVSDKEAERRAWATVNDRTGGGQKK